MKCIVLGCSNSKGEGTFVGDICGPCHYMLTSGVVSPSTNWMWSISCDNVRLRAEAEVLRTAIQNARLCLRSGVL